MARLLSGAAAFNLLAVTVRATRYVTPLREGGSLPALMEADDDGLYVVKFRGAGQGPKALAAELLAGELARRLGLLVPEIELVDVDPVLGLAEPDPEIQDLITGSAGLNVGLDFLPGALPFEPAAAEAVDPSLAAAIVWFDALVTNVDRTPRNPNLLVWHERLWLIDHGAAFYGHHGSDAFADSARRPFPLIAEHVLLPFSGSVKDADGELAARLDRSVLEEIAGLVPEEWIAAPGEYVSFLEARLAEPRGFVEEAEDARLAAR
jgi:hypothetical protein